MNLSAQAAIRRRPRRGARLPLTVAAATLLVLVAAMVGRADAACYYPGSNCNAYAFWSAGQTAPWLGPYPSVFNIFTKQPPGTPGRSKSQRVSTGGAVSAWYSDTALYHQVNFPNSQTRQTQCKNSSAYSNEFLCGYNGV